jgi:hypothetical protein
MARAAADINLSFQFNNPPRNQGLYGKSSNARLISAADQSLTATDHRHLYSVTSAFELTVWMLRRYSALLAAAQPQVEPAVDAAPLVSAEALRNS